MTPTAQALAEVVALADVLEGSQERCDEDGTMIAVSRQAVCEIVAAIRTLAQLGDDPWKPSEADYDRNIHCNPDAKAWADFFVATFPGQAEQHDLMLGWFANAMMAMHDHQRAQLGGEREVVVAHDAEVRWAIDRWHAEVCQRPLVNVHRRSLDDTWRQVIRHFGGDDVSLCGPRHDELLAAATPTEPAQAGRDGGCDG